ncbi:MAG: hypothetical protein HYV61_13700 [Candidatus Rokubacteria bacterium]|nr:hypothetical protein [Candidatus Rokubacteria bacterium]MBI2879785.1 hypothetical protein [Candidatus Rokubacteria bacterium]
MTVSGPVLALVRDLIFSSKIGESAKAVGRPVAFARNVEEFRARLGDNPGLVLVDLTAGGLDLDAALRTYEAAGRPAPLIGWTTHALWKATAPLHSRCDRVMTREELSQELPALLREHPGGDEEVR